MTEAQSKFYWRLWGDARKALLRGGLSSAEANARRHELHVEALGADKSHATFSNRDFDQVKAAFLAVIKSDNMRPQIAQVRMPAARVRGRIEQLLCVLGKDEDYLAGIAARMNFQGALGRMFMLEEANEEQLKKLAIALNKQCRRNWPTKDAILAEIYDFCSAHEIDDQSACDALQKILGGGPLVSIERLHWEDLVTVLAAVRELVNSPF